MKIWSKFPMVLGVIGCMLASAWAGPAPPAEASAAIRAIQQASDPSAVVAAYANGVATDRNDPKLYEAYVSRMVDLGLPELAYHQAQTLTTLESNNGLAWGVVAYADARRGEMPDAITAINLAGQAAPSNPFVQRTAGEIVAWYDIKADQSKLPPNAKDGLAKVRALLEQQAAFTAAYDTAKDAYQAQAKAAQEPAQAAPSQYQYGSAPQSQPQGDQIAPLGYTASPLPYYSDYYYDGGAGWIEPAPWWWQPVGFFAGFDFFPFSTVIVFDHHHFFHHHDFFVHDHFFFHNHAFFHDQFFHHNGLNVAFHGPNGFFFRDGKTAFFGTVARPNTSLALSLRASFHTASSFASSRVLIDPTARPSTMPGMSGFASSATPMRQSALSPGRASSMLAPSLPMRSGLVPRSNLGMRPLSPQFAGGMPPSARMMPGFPGGMAGQGFRAPAFATPGMSSHGMMPMSRGFAGGGFHGGGGAHGGHR